MEIKGYVQSLWTMLFPTYCLLCFKSLVGGTRLCAGCRQDLPEIDHACVCCALPLPQSDEPGLCGQCLRSPRAFDLVIAPYYYAYPMVYLIKRFKFHQHFSTGRLLSALIAERAMAMAQEANILIPVPLHHSRLSERGFNQAKELSQYLSVLTGIKTGALLRRDLDTVTQIGLSAAQRRRNLKGAFSVRGNVTAKHVVLIDDVMTTGSTADACARVLKRAGATRVDVWVCARA